MGEARRRKAVTGALAAGNRLRPLAARAPLGPITKLTAPAGPGLPPRPVALRALALAEEIREAARENLLAASATGNLDTVLDAVTAIGAGTIGDFENAMTARLATESPPKAEMDRVECRRGCAFCCHVDVVVTPFEAIRLATAMRRGEIPDRRAEIAGAIRAKAAGPARHIACPMLADGACTAYEMRPFACRSLFSTSAALCEAGFGGEATAAVPSLTWPRYLAMGYLTGQLAAMRDLGFSSELVELRAALALLLADETAALRWLNGEAVFAPHIRPQSAIPEPSPRGHTPSPIGQTE